MCIFLLMRLAFFLCAYFSFVCFLYYQSVTLEVAPRLKNREINELEKTGIESLSRFCHTFDYEKVGEEER